MASFPLLLALLLGIIRCYVASASFSPYGEASPPLMSPPSYPSQYSTRTAPSSNYLPTSSISTPSTYGSSSYASPLLTTPSLAATSVVVSTSRSSWMNTTTSGAAERSTYRSFVSSSFGPASTPAGTLQSSTPSSPGQTLPLISPISAISISTNASLGSPSATNVGSGILTTSTSSSLVLGTPASPEVTSSIGPTFLTSTKSTTSTIAISSSTSVAVTVSSLSTQSAIWSNSTSAQSISTSTLAASNLSLASSVRSEDSTSIGKPSTNATSIPVVSSNSANLPILSSTASSVAPMTSVPASQLPTFWNTSAPVTSSLGPSVPVVSTLPDGQPTNFTQSAKLPTNSEGPTIVPNPAGDLTIPNGLSTPTLFTLPGGQLTTFTPPVPSSAFSTNSEGLPIFSNGDETLTMSLDVTAPSAFTFSDGRATTIMPFSWPTSTSSWPFPSFSTNNAGYTILTNDAGTLTVPSIITTPTVLTFPDGQTTTITPFSWPTTSSAWPELSFSTNSEGFTILTDDAATLTVPLGITEPTALTFPDGQLTTFIPIDRPPSSSSTSPDWFLIPVTTSVDKPKATDHRSSIPCKLWFFWTCISFWDFGISGWEFELPTGPHPPGPPPGIKPPPGLHISFSIPLPDWPEFTIGPDHMPTFPTEPEGPCKTKTAELCATTTSFDVSVSDTATTSTSSSVLSTCATIWGCDVEDSATSATTTSSTSCSVSASLSTETGRCENGNYPLYDPINDNIICDIPNDVVPSYLSGCQKYADEFPEYSREQIECFNSCPAEQGGADTKQVSGPGDHRIFEDFTGLALDDLANQKVGGGQTCPVVPPLGEPGEVHHGIANLCDVTFECNTDLWPNVCNNAKSAQDLRAKPTALQYKGKRTPGVTRQWYFSHFKEGNLRDDNTDTNQKRDAGNMPGQPFGGWGLLGCEVEEYPHGSTGPPQGTRDEWKWANKAVIRLIPWEENRDHGVALKQFYNNAKKGDATKNPKIKPMPDKGFTFCVQVTGNNVDTQEYLLGDRAQTYNRCGQAYGPAFLLQNERTETDRRAAMAAGPAVWAAESKWDPWFSRKSQLFDHTTYSSGADIRTTRLPSQYGSEPAPGLKTFITSPGGNPNLGTWTTSAPGKARIGSSVLRVTPGPSGKSLRWDSPNAYHNGILKRGEHYSASATVTSTMTSAPIAYPSTQQTFAPTALASVTGKTTSLTPVLAYQVPDFHMRRQAMENGSFLDARVYREAFGCSAPDIDPCLEEDCWDGGSVYETDGIIANFSSVGLTSVSGGSSPTLSSTSNSTSPTSSPLEPATTEATSATSLSPALPTLTETEFSTPSGSSCAATVPVTECNGSGEQSVCLTSSSCGSWTATDPPTTTQEAPTSTFFTVPASQSSAVRCNDESRFPGHADIHKGAVARWARWACWPDIYLTDVDAEHPGSRRHEKSHPDGNGVNYHFIVEYLADCVPGNADQFPACQNFERCQEIEGRSGGGDSACAERLLLTYTSCKGNGGVGGSLQVGCLVYTFIGGE